MTAPVSGQGTFSAILRRQNTHSNLVLLGTVAVAWLGTGIIALYVKRANLFIGFDGGYMRDLARRRFEWDLPRFLASMDWFQGLGDSFFAVNFGLLPAFIGGSPFGTTSLAKVVTYEILLFELTLAVFLFGISAGASRAISVTAALVTCITLLPFSHPSLIYGILALAPQVGTLIAGSLLIGAAFLQFGRRSLWTDALLVLIVVTLLGWLALVSITFIILAAPFLLLCAVSGTIAAQSQSERRRKIALFAAVILFLSAAGPGVYLVGSILNTAAVIFPEELANDRASLYFASIVFHWRSIGPVGPILVLLAIAGAVVAAFNPTQRTLQILGIALLTYLGSRLAFAVLVILFDFWRGPAALYFEFYVIPLYAIFASSFCARLLQWLWQHKGWPAPHNRQLDFILVGAGIVTVLAVSTSTQEKSRYGFPYPPEVTSITEILQQESGLQLGSAFRGRTANMTGRLLNRDIDWFDLHSLDDALSREIGNDLRLAGLNYFGIPTLFQYTPTISPFMYVVTSRLLARPGDRQMRNVLVVRKSDPRILAMLGVRFVITDRENDEVIRRISISTSSKILYLEELANPNLGQYSPTVVNNISNATDIIARLEDPRFNPAREIIGDVPGNTNDLVPAAKAHLVFDGALLRLIAESSGRSILLIPLEFSRCLKATPVQYGKPLLFRANLLETGVLFSRRVDVALALRTGPFLRPACRLRDFVDARTLAVGEVPRRVPSSGPHR